MTPRNDLDAFLRPNEIIFVRRITEGNPNKWLHDPHAPNDDTLGAIFSARALNGLLGVLTLSLIYATAFTFTKHSGVAWLALALTATLGSFHAVHAGVTNDSLVVMLYSAGVLWLVRWWRNRRLRGRDVALMSVIVVGASLAKLTGVSLWGVLCLAMLMGVRSGRVRLMEAGRIMGWTGVALMVGAGWWYARNWMLYGDPFALTATQALWGREFDSVADLLTPLQEIERLWRSFWWMVGYRHEPLLANDAWLMYGTLVLMLAGVGLVLGWRRARENRGLVALMMGVVLVVALSVIVGTRNVDISYGRLLYPALVALMPLMAWGLWQVAGRLAVLVVVPFVGFALMMPTQLAEFYPRLSVLTPADAPHEVLHIEDIAWWDTSVAPDGILRFEVTLAGGHRANVPLMVTVIDPVTDERVAHAEIYAGMAPTDALRADGRYRARLQVPLSAPDNPQTPRSLDVYLRFDAPELPAQRFESPVRHDVRYRAPGVDVARSAHFGEVIALHGYTLSSTAEHLDVRLIWSALRPIGDDYTLTVQLMDADGTLIAQNDGVVPAYPTSRWLVDVAFEDVRRLDLPRTMPAGAYRLYVGWYHQADLMRLPPTSEDGWHDLLLLTDVALP